MPVYVKYEVFIPEEKRWEKRKRPFYLIGNIKHFKEELIFIYGNRVIIKF